MGWEIHGVGNPWKSMSKSRIFGNPDFDKKSRFENKLANFLKDFFKFWGICIMFRHYFFDAVSNKIAPELIFRTDGEITDFFRPKPNIEKITNGILRI